MRDNVTDDPTPEDDKEIEEKQDKQEGITREDKREIEEIQDFKLEHGGKGRREIP